MMRRVLVIANEAGAEVAEKRLRFVEKVERCGHACARCELRSCEHECRVGEHSLEGEKPGALRALV